MASKTPILFLGATGMSFCRIWHIYFLIHATGYIGGSVLARLLARADASKYEITALVRSPEKAKKLATFGVKTVEGSVKDIALLSHLAEQAHAVFSLVSSFFSHDSSRADENALPLGRL